MWSRHFLVVIVVLVVTFPATSFLTRAPSVLSFGWTMMFLSDPSMMRQLLRQPLRCRSFGHAGSGSLVVKKAQHGIHSRPSRFGEEGLQSRRRKIAVVGGGLAGLSVVYHLLQNNASHHIEITVIDKCHVGEGGASSVAGGLLHPFSPRGKLLYMGRQGLEASNTLLSAAMRHRPNCVLRNRLFRIAQTERHVQELRAGGIENSEYASWCTPEDIQHYCGTDAKSLGGFMLTNGCKVVHVPSYLKGLWAACQDLVQRDSSLFWSVEPTIALTEEESPRTWRERLQAFDSVVLCAGAGLFQDFILPKGDASHVSVDLVRGQSIEMSLPPDRIPRQQEALLCGKYVVPLPNDDNGSRFLIGATHEFKFMTEDEAVQDLKSRTYELSPSLWDNGHIDRVTSGIRVQSRRGKYGRLPILGRILHKELQLHGDAWIFTGLSSRGLIYHGVFGQMLSNAILSHSEEELFRSFPEVNWWRRTERKTR